MRTMGKMEVKLAALVIATIAVYYPPPATATHITPSPALHTSATPWLCDFEPASTASIDPSALTANSTDPFLELTSTGDTGDEDESVPLDLNADLRKRQNSSPCGQAYDSCGSIGNPQLCCPKSAICTGDNAGQVACCPMGAACTGTIGRTGGQGMPQTSTSSAVVPTGSPEPTSSDNGNGGVFQQTGGAGGIIVDGTPVQVLPAAAVGVTPPVPFRIVVTILKKVTNIVLLNLNG